MNTNATASTSPPPLSGAEARRAARNAGAIAAARILSSAALLVWQLILGRWLGDSAFGIYNTVGGLYTIGVTLTAFGISAIYIRDIARHPAYAGRYAAASLTMQTLLGLLAYVGISGAGAALGYSEAIRAYAAVASISLFIDLVGNVAYDTLLGREKMVIASAVDVAHILVRIALASAALALGFGLLGVYLVTIMAGIGRSAGLWMAAVRAGVRPIFPADRRLAWALLIGGAPLALSGFINQTYTQLDKLMTTSLLTTADTGHLGAAFVILAGVIELLSTTVIVAVYPMMARAFDPEAPLDSERNATFRLLIEKLSFYSLIIVIPVGLVISAFSHAIALPLFGDDFAPTADVLRVLIWYGAVAITVNVYAQGMIAMNRQRTLVLVRTSGLILKLGLNLLLLPRLGVIGAAFASVLAELLVFACILAVYRFGQRLRALLPQLIRLAGAAAAGLIGMLAFGLAHPLLGMLTGTAIYGAALIGLRVLAVDDWDLIYRLVAAVPGGGIIRRYWKRDIAINW